MTRDAHSQFHEAWLGMVQPTEGLVVSVPVLVEAQCMERHGPELQERLRTLCPIFDAETGLLVEEELTGRSRRKRETLEDQLRRGRRRYRDLGDLVRDFLDWPDELIDEGDTLPDDLSRYIAEGRQRIRPTMALRKLDGDDAANATDQFPDIETPESEAGKPYVALVWELPPGLSFDRPETETGEWRYPPAAKFDRLLRACRVPIGFLTNHEAVRLIYAPHGEATGSLTFDLTEMSETGGRPILDAFWMLSSGYRFFGADADRALPALLHSSRERQANVTNTLAGQVFDALDLLLQGFAVAAQRDREADLDALIALAAGDDPDTRLTEDDHLYGGLLTVLLRLVFILYAEDRELLPTDSEHYTKGLSLGQLFEDLQRDHSAFPDTMSQRFGAWPRLLALFRCIYEGVEHAEFKIPRRRGELFNPNRFPFLETWGRPNARAPFAPADRAASSVPTIDDETVFGVLERLLVLEGQRLSYKVLDVEQIGAVYEALMGYGVIRLASPAVCCRHKSLQPGSRGGVWIEAAVVLDQKARHRARFLRERYDVVRSQTARIAKQLEAAKDEPAVLEALEAISLRTVKRRERGQLALQPGEERRRTSSHYTPRSLSEPIVRRTLEPLLVAMSEAGELGSEQLLDLKICDPAMGSGAFLVEACRFLADHVVAAWEREGQTDKVGSAKEDVVIHARRLVAQRCLYGVDKNPFAVSLAKLSLWLVTLAREEPFTFVDHCLRHGDSLVGLSIEQIAAFHWKPDTQLDFIEETLRPAIDEALALRRQILALAGNSSPELTGVKEKLLWDAEDALEPARQVGDLVVGAFFDARGTKAQKAELRRRLDELRRGLGEDFDVPEELVALADDLREKVPTFHWQLAFPEVFTHERTGPVTGSPNGSACFDAFVGNPPFLGGTGFNRQLGDDYCRWLLSAFEGSNGNANLCSYFFSRSEELLGDSGAIGLIATNTIGQGDTRAAGLQQLVARGLRIYDATSSFLWPGAANVSVSVVHLAKGDTAKTCRARRLDGEPVESINSRLRGKPERPDPVELPSNSGLAFKGVDVYGIGFAITLEEAAALLEWEPCAREVVRPYLGGKELNSSPTQTFNRYVIDFGERTLEQCETYPKALAMVRERVLPARLAIKSKSKAAQKLKTFWWRFGRRTPTLDKALVGLERCLVSAQTTKHLCLAFQPTDRVFSQKLWVFPRDDYGFFGVMQSRLHEMWVWLLSATMKSDLSYCASDCFDNFPFPEDSALSMVEDAAQGLYEARSRLMAEREQGLTTTYNQLKSDERLDEDIENLRSLHVGLDRAVLAAYGWSDIEPPAYASTDVKSIKRFEDEVIDRLFSLNAERGRLERSLGLATKSRKPTKRATSRDVSSKGQVRTTPGTKEAGAARARSAEGSERRG